MQKIFLDLKNYLKKTFLYLDESVLLKRIEGIKLLPDQSLTFAVIIPMYNEQESVLRCVSTINEFLESLPYKSRIVVVNDKSCDDTPQILEEMKNKYPRLIVCHHAKNIGYGGANVTGTREAHSLGLKYSVFMDADLTQNVKYLYGFLVEMLKDVDMIKATRYSGGGGVNGVPGRRWIVSYVGNSIARHLLRLKLTDYTNGFRAIKTELLVKNEFEEQGFAYLIEEVIKISKTAKTFANVPYVLTVRNDGNSKFLYSYRVYWSYLKWLFKK